MPSTSVTIAVIFAAMLAIFGIMIWIDRRTTYIFPQKFNYNDGKSESNGPQAEAVHLEDNQTGAVTAKAIARENGNALSTAELGYEYQNSGAQVINLIVKITFDYQVNLETNTDQSTVAGKVETFVNAKSACIIDDSLSKPGSLFDPESGGLNTCSQSHSVSLQPGEKFVAYLKLTANATAAANGDCVSQVTGKVTEISYRPHKIIM